MADNYEIQLQLAAGLFLELDQKRIIQKLSLQSDSSAIYIRFMGADYVIDRYSGIVTQADTGLKAGYGPTMCIYDYLSHSNPIKNTVRKKSPINSLMGKAHPGVGETSMYNKYARAFNSAPDKFEIACLQLGGRVYPRGDKAFEFEVFDGLNLVVQLWMSDEEFPPHLSLLWDEHVLDILMYETTWFACGFLLEQILNAMD